MSVFTSDVTVEPGLAPIQVDGSAFTQPVSGTVTANAGTGTFIVDGSGVTQPVSGTITANAGTGTFIVDGSGVTQPVSGTVAVTQSTSPWVISGTVTTSGNKATAASITRVATSTTAATVLAANAARKKFVIRTETGTHTYVAYGSTATSTNYTVDLGQDATLEETVWTGSVSVVRLSGTGNVQVTDLV